MIGLRIGIDLGTSSVTAYVEGKGIVLSEPSVIACESDTGRTLAVGEAAYEMLGKSPDFITLCRPLSYGTVSDFPMTEQMLRFYIQKICGNKIFKPNVVVSVPSTLTSLEKRTLLDVVTAAGAGRACLIEEPLAAAIGSDIDLDEPRGTLVVDIGGETVDTAVITMGSIAVSNCVRMGGRFIDDAIIRFLRRERDVIIGQLTAEQIKKQIGCAVLRDEEVAMIAGGKSYLTGMPINFEINSTEFYFAVLDCLKIIVGAVRSVLEVTPPELMSDIYDNGILLTGAGALIYGAAELLERETGIPSRVAADAAGCAAKGTGMALANIKYLMQNGYLFKSGEDLRI
ncbi:MAG: rod shape-determining protein [Clostridiales bacterium]|nr:rod shape-determining protein [Clostridiales bacterium]